MTAAVEHRGSAELPLLAVTTPDLSVVFAPTLGGRLLSLAVGGRELLWRNPALIDGSLGPVVPVVGWPRGDGGMSSWANVGGSKTWPAPQGWAGPDEWAGPPDPVLDSGAWSAEYSSSANGTEVTLTSPDDPRTGLRVTRRFFLPGAGSTFTEIVRFENVSVRERRWAIWEVCQVDTAPGGELVADAVVVVPHAGDPVELDLGSYEGRVVSAHEGGDVRLPLGTGVAKRGYPRAVGAARYREPSGLELELRGRNAPSGQWPDGGSKVEIWIQRPTSGPLASLEGLHPSAHLVELEVLGPLTLLAPGDRSELEITWSVSRPSGGPV